jgi:hypothetical protein
VKKHGKFNDNAYVRLRIRLGAGGDGGGRF